jgi:hypothetical protein
MLILPAEACKQTLNDWRDSAAEYIRAELFDKKQFITDEEIGMGGSIQKLVCAYINISGYTFDCRGVAVAIYNVN